MKIYGYSNVANEISLKVEYVSKNRFVFRNGYYLHFRNLGVNIDCYSFYPLTKKQIIKLRKFILTKKF
jgi:hypothetical protein